MTETTRQKIFEKLQALDEYSSYLQRLKTEVQNEKQFLSDFRLFGSVERYLQLSYQVIIDILDLIIIEKGIEKPDDKRETISLLFNKGVLSENLASRLDGSIGFRNILVHDYGKIDRKMVYTYLMEKTDNFDIFKKEILIWLKKF